MKVIRTGKIVAISLAILAFILLPAAFGSPQTFVFNNSLPEVNAYLVAASVLIGLGLFRKQRHVD